MIETCTRTAGLTKTKVQIWIILILVYIKKTGFIISLSFERKYLLCMPATGATDIQTI